MRAGRETGVTISLGGVLEQGGVTVSSGVFSASVVAATTVLSGATLSAGAILDTLNATVRSGAAETVGSGATAFSTIVSSGGTETALAGGVANGATILAGGTLSGPGALIDVATDAGKILGVAVSGALTVSSGGLVSGGSIASGGTVTVLAGGVVQALTVSSGGTLIDNGSAVYSGSTATTFAGALSGSGTVTEQGTGSLVFNGADSGFAGTVVISGGTVELATSGGVGKAAVTFASTAGSATLQIDAADTPAAGTTFSSTLNNFDQTFDGLDLRGVAFVSGATAVVSGTTLVVTDGGKVYDFKLGGTIGASYHVTSDGHGGTLVYDPPLARASPRLDVAASNADTAFAHAFWPPDGPVTQTFGERPGVFGADNRREAVDLAAAHRPHA